MSDITKSCPYCAEEIKLAAIVCKHCKRELPGFKVQNDNFISRTERKPRKYYEETETVTSINRIFDIQGRANRTEFAILAGVTSPGGGAVLPGDAT